MNEEFENATSEETAESSERTEGLVKWFNKDKGYGFINIEDEPKDIFVHFSEIRVEGFKTLMEGSRVRFELVENEKGLVAKEVVVLEVPAAPPAGAAGGYGKFGGGESDYRPSYGPPGADRGDGGDLSVSCPRTSVNVSFHRQGNRRRLVVESNGGPGVQVLERMWRNLMQFEGVGADHPGSLRLWLKIFKAFSGHAYNTQGTIPAWIGSEQARDELRIEGLVR